MTLLALGGRVWRRVRALALLSGLIGAMAACADDPIGPEGQPFGRIGGVVLEVLTPSAEAAGEIRHVVDWSSNGTWRSTEQILYQGRLGDETVYRSNGDVASLARAYAAWINLVNDTPSVTLFGDLVDPTLVPICANTGSRVTLRIVDRIRADTASWTRCSVRSLPNLSGEGAGPDANASRVAQAAALMRDFTLAQQRSFRFQYTGSVPFATLVRGDESAFQLSVPRVIEDSQSWHTFWAALTGAAGASAPTVDFDLDLVLVGAVGTRFEAGDSVEIRGVLPVGNGTQISLWERRAGHFCTPARRTHVPYHVVVAPQVPRPIFFSDVSLDTVPCG